MSSGAKQKRLELINTLSFELFISIFRKAVFRLYFPFHIFVLWPFSNLCEYVSCLRLARCEN